MGLSIEQILARLKELQEQMRYYGLIMGGALILTELLQYWLYDSITYSNILTFALLKILIVFFASVYLTKRIKKEFFKNGINYMQCFSIIFRLFMYGAILAGIFVFILNNWIDAEFQARTMDGLIVFLESNIEMMQLPEAQMNQIENMINTAKEAPIPTAAAVMWNKMWSYLSLGAFVAFILSFFMRNATPRVVKQQEDDKIQQV